MLWLSLIQVVRTVAPAGSCHSEPDWILCIQDGPINIYTLYPNFFRSWRSDNSCFHLATTIFFSFFRQSDRRNGLWRNIKATSWVRSSQSFTQLSRLFAKTHVSFHWCHISSFTNKTTSFANKLCFRWSRTEIQKWLDLIFLWSINSCKTYIVPTY